MKFLKGSKLYSVITGCCPVCHNENMYVFKNPYKIPHTLSMMKRCSYCKTKYSMEPSFFFGAMYVSYPVGIVFATIAFAIAYMILELSLFQTFMAITITMILCLPIILRLSRNIWINIFRHYQKPNE